MLSDVAMNYEFLFLCLYSFSSVCRSSWFWKAFLTLLSAVEIFGWLLFCLCSSQSTGASEFWEVYVHSKLTPRVFLKSNWKHRFSQIDWTFHPLLFRLSYQFFPTRICFSLSTVKNGKYATMKQQLNRAEV